MLIVGHLAALALERSLSQCSDSLETAIKQQNIEEATQLASALKDIFAETRIFIEKDTT